MPDRDAPSSRRRDGSARPGPRRRRAAASASPRRRGSGWRAGARPGAGRRGRAPCRCAASISVRRQSAVLEGEGNLILDGQGAELAVGILKDEGDGLGPGARRLPADGSPCQLDGAFEAGRDRLRNDAVEAERQARLAAARGAEQQDALAGIDAEREVAQRRAGPEGMGEGQALDLEPGPTSHLMPPDAWRHRCRDLAARRSDRAPRRCAARASPPEARRWRGAGRT